MKVYKPFRKCSRLNKTGEKSTLELIRNTTKKLESSKFNFIIKNNSNNNSNKDPMMI